MMRLFRGRRSYDLWLLETTARMLEAATRTSDVRKILTLWCEEIAAASRTGSVAIFLSEGDRWLRLLPEKQTEEVPVVAPDDLARARTQRRAWMVAPLRSQDPRCAIAPFSIREGWSGVLLLWSRVGRASRRQLRDAESLAKAIGRSLYLLRRSETSREETVAEEKAKWASQLHDGFLQSLLSAKLHAEVCQALEDEHEETCSAPESGSPRRSRDELVRTRALLEESVREVRSFLLEQRSPPGTPEEFLPWLRDYAEDFTRENAIHVEIRVEGSGELSKTQASESIRLVREALTNVRRHANASSVRIVVAFADHGTTISVSDDGIGFDVKAVLERILDSSHNGLIGMRYRTESIGGVLRVRSEPEKGTTLQFRLPRPQKRTTEEVSRGEKKETSPLARFASRDTDSDLFVPDSIRASLADAIAALLDEEPPAEPAPDGRT
ncbi:MAG TPA: ATP-binding protein [Thermoanaerobaculia bacterium]